MEGFRVFEIAIYRTINVPLTYPRAVDREFNYNLGSNFGGGRRGVRAPPHPPAFQGAPPPGPPKRRSAPLAAAVVRFLAAEPLVKGSFAALGRTLFQKSDYFLNKPLVLGSFAAWGRTFHQKSNFFSQATCPGQLRCLGQNCLSESIVFF